jgi:hypothetical protein
MYIMFHYPQRSVYTSAGQSSILISHLVRQNAQECLIINMVTGNIQRNFRSGEGKYNGPGKL